MEAGNFRLPQKTIKQMDGAFSMQAYKDFYEAKVKELEVSPINFASIAMVCNIKSEQAKSNLTDMFACLIELSRGKHSPVKLAMKGLGALHVLKNKEIFFSGDVAPVQNTENDYDFLYEAKSGAQEVSTVLDGASAILSQKGGGGLLSVRSGYLSTLSSVKTPRSKIT